MDRKSLEPWLLDSVEFRPYQVEGVRFLIQRRNPILADDMGLGKSLQAMTAFATDVKMGWGDTALIIAPATLKDNWANEFKKFTRIPYTVLGQRVNRNGKTVSTGRDERIQQIVGFALSSGPRALIINYEQVAAHLEELNACGFHMAIFDEVHYLGNYDSQRTIACLQIKARRKIQLSGTPVTSQVNNLWAIMWMAARGRTPNYNTFMNRYAAYGGFGGKQIVGVKNKDEIHEILGDTMLRRVKEDVLDLPPVDIIPIYVRLTPEQQKLYDEVVNEMQLTTTFDPENPMEVDNHLTKTLRLKQICGSTHPFTGEDHSNKLHDAVARAAELTASGHKVVVWTQFRDILDLFVQRLAHVRKGSIPVWQLHGDVAIPDRFATVEAWGKSHTAGVLASMIQVGATGLNMVASRHAIFLDETYIPATNKQAIDRQHRIGQQSIQPVTVWKYITVDTVEERIQEICTHKDGVFDELITEVHLKGELLKDVLPQAQMSIDDIAGAFQN